MGYFNQGSVSHSVIFDSLQPHGLKSARLLCPWASPGKNTGVGCHSVLQGISLTQGSNPGLLQCSQILYCLSYREAHFKQGKKIFRSFLARDPSKVKTEHQTRFRGLLTWVKWLKKVRLELLGALIMPPGHELEYSHGLKSPSGWVSLHGGMAMLQDACLPACLLSGS